MFKEIWKAVKGYEDLYEVSNKGSVRSLDRYSRHVSKAGKIGVKFIKGKLMKPRVKDNEYLYVALCKDGTIHNRYIHRLVAEAFLPKEAGKDFVDHIDTNRTNNSVENLRWCTISENHYNPLTVLKKCIKYKGQNANEIALQNGISRERFHARLCFGWSVEDACTRPIDKRFACRKA